MKINSIIKNILLKYIKYINIYSCIIFFQLLIEKEYSIYLFINNNYNYIYQILEIIKTELIKEKNKLS